MFRGALVEDRLASSRIFDLTVPYDQRPGITIRELRASEVDREALRRATADEARADVAAFPTLVEAILDVFQDASPLHVIATIAGWGLVQSIGSGTVSNRKMIDGIEQHHVELLQALLLTIGRDRWGTFAPTNSQMHTVIAAIRDLSTAFHRRRRLQLEGMADDMDALVNVGLQERIRDHTQMVRNWGYYDEMVRITRAMHAPLDDAFAARMGFRLGDVVDVADALVKLREERIGNRFASLREIFRGRTRRALVDAFFARYGYLLTEDAEQFLAAIPRRVTLKRIRMELQEIADRDLIMDMVVDPEVIALRLGLASSVVTRIFTALAMRPEALCDSDRERLFLSNPVWLRPALLDDGDFIVFSPQSIVSFLPSILRDLLTEAGMTKALEWRRAQYLEEETARIVAGVLPGAKVLRNVVWSWEGVSYETDIVAVFDRVVLIVEAKSGALTPSGLRGAPDSVRRHVRSLLVKPAEQSARLRDIITAARHGDEVALALVDRLGFGVPAAKVDTVIRLSVTLDDFSTLSSAQAELKRAGLLPAELDLPATMGIADLSTCAEILDDPLFFLHYLTRRERIQRGPSVFGDELDFLGTYLQCGLVMPEVEAGTHTCMLSGMSRSVDDYYVLRGAGQAVTKPRPRVEPYLGAILERLRSRSSNSWTTMGLTLLDAVPIGADACIEDAIEEVAAAVFDAPVGATPGTLVARGDNTGALALFQVYRRAQEDELLDRMTEAADDALERFGPGPCVVFARMLERWDLPYAVAAPIRLPAQELR